MAVRNIYDNFVNVSTKTNITLSFTGAGFVDIDCYYTINNNIVNLYIPMFSSLTITTGSLTAQLPQEITPLTTTNNMFVIRPSTQSTITINSNGTITFGPFTIGQNCGTLYGQTIIYNLN